MSYEADVMQWLRDLPVGKSVEIDGETVCLDVQQGGAILHGRLLYPYSQAQLQDALQCGFQSALTHQAGVGVSADGSELVLNRWLPKVRSWTEAAGALEDLLNQLVEWREAMAPASTERTALASVADRNEQRLRRLFAGAQK